MLTSLAFFCRVNFVSNKKYLLPAIWTGTAQQRSNDCSIARTFEPPKGEPP